MKKITSLWKYFSLAEKMLWVLSVLLIVVSFFVFGNESYLTLAASLIGVTSLIFCAKGNPFGLFLMIIFSLIYGYISFFCAYYGEMITYIGMTLPMSAFSLVSWLRNPYKGKKTEVEVNHIGKKEYVFISALTALVTFVFYFILAAFNTANLLISTFSVATSFFAVCLSFCRSPYFALVYAANDIVLVCLWLLATVQDISYLSVVMCFATFLANDIYGFISWRRMEKKQSLHS